MAVVLPAAALDGYGRFSLYNSPFPPHEEGCAVDLYLAGGGASSPPRRSPGPSGTPGPSEDRPRPRPRGARPPRRPPGRPRRQVEAGDPLGETVRSGFFAPWVADHLHLGLRPADRNLRRATGSLPLSGDVRAEPLPWDGTGRVATAGDTYVVLDAPAHPAPGEGWVGVAGTTGLALDGGVPHYPGGGAYAVGGRPDGSRVVSPAGTPVGRTDGRTVRWRDVTVTANGHPTTGVSLAVARDAAFGVTLVARDGHPFVVGDPIEVAVAPRG